MGILSTLKSVFLPSAQTAADRRLATFGTTSKVPAIIAAAVVGAAVALPPVRAIVGAIITKHPIASALSIPIVAGGGLRLIKPAITTTKKATEVAVPILLKEKPLTPEGFKDVAKVVGIIGGAGLLGAGVGIIGKKILEKKEEVKETALGAGESPILPATTTISTAKKQYRRRKAQIMPSVRQSVRVNIINRPVNTGIRILNKRYINERVYA